MLHTKRTRVGLRVRQQLEREREQQCVQAERLQLVQTRLLPFKTEHEGRVHEPEAPAVAIHASNAISAHPVGLVVGVGRKRQEHDEDEHPGAVERGIGADNLHISTQRASAPASRCKTLNGIRHTTVTAMTSRRSVSASSHQKRSGLKCAAQGTQKGGFSW